MKKSELKKRTCKMDVESLQKIGRSDLLLLAVEVIVWNLQKMSPPLFLAILGTCAVEVTVCAVSLKEISKQRKEEN